MSLARMEPHTNYKTMADLDSRMHGVNNPVFLSDVVPSNPEHESSDSSPSSETGNENDFDPHDFGNTDNPTSFWGTVLHLIVIIGGPAMMSIPKSSVGVGYAVVALLMPLIVLFYVHSMHMLMWSEYQISKIKRLPSLSYPEAVYHAFKLGPPAVQWLSSCCKILSHFLFLTLWFFSGCYNYVIVCQNLQVFLQNVFNCTVDMQRLVLYFFLSFLFLFSIRKLSYLVPFSFVGNIVNFVTFILVLYYVFTVPSPWKMPQPFEKIEKIPVFVGTVISTASATGIMISLKSEMRTPKRFDSRYGALQTSYIPIAIFFTLFSVVCYLKYGSDLKNSVIENLPKDAAFAQVGILLSTFTLIIQYPLVMYVPLDLIWNHILKKTKESVEHKLVWEYVMRFVLVALSLGFSITNPNILVFVSLCGNVGSSIDSFVLPACMQTLVAWKLYDNNSRFHRILIKNVFIVSVALLIMITGLVNSIEQFGINFD